MSSTMQHAPQRARRKAAIFLAAGVGVLCSAGAAVAQDASSDVEVTVLPTAPQAWDIPGEWIVDAEDDLTDAEVAALAADYGLTFRETALEDETRIELTHIRADRAAALIPRLSKDARIEHVEPLARVEALYVVDDPLFKQQWHMSRVGAPTAWDFATGRGVTVAVVDTGVACETHGPFTKGTDLALTECVPGWNFVSNNEHANDDQGHGTHVAGTIAQSTNNGLGAAGLAFHASLMPVKVLNGRGSGTTAAVADGIRWAADNGADVINLSLGSPRNSRVLQEAVNHAREQGALVIAAAGNSSGPVGFPGGCEGVIGVSATDGNDKLASFSSRGKGVDIAAPGVSVTQQTVCNGGRGGCEVFPNYSGTSMASPHVAGVAALLVSQGVTDPDAVEEILQSTARVVDESPDAHLRYGAGILDAAAAVKSVWIKQTVARLAFLIGMIALLARSRRVKGLAKPQFFLPALAAGPGLFFFAPWVLSRAVLPIDLLARPLGDMSLLLGTSLHQWLPFANLLIPLGATAVFFGSKTLRPIAAGLGAGTAAYLLAAVAIGGIAAPMGFPLMAVWCLGNAVASIWLAKMNLEDGA